MKKKKKKGLKKKLCRLLLVNFILTIPKGYIWILKYDLVLNFKAMNLKCFNSKSINFKILYLEAF